MERRYYNRELESMTRAELEAYQWYHLKRQVAHTYAVSGLCQRQFKQAKITPDDIKSMADFRNKVPFTTKRELIADQEACPPWGTRLGVPEKEVFYTFVTSGTSGKGQEVHAETRSDYDRHIDRGCTNYAWSGWEKGDKVMLPLPLSMTAAAPTHFLALQKLGCNVFNLGMYDTQTKLQWLRRFQIVGMFSNPAYLDTLTTEAEQMGIDPARDLAVRKILMALSAYPISFVEKMEAKWNAKIYDYYGGTQGADSATCEKGAVWQGKRGFYHLFEHMTLHEVIDPETVQPVGPGEVGEMVVTPLIREASPFLRFRMADRVRWFPYDACDCGRPFNAVEAGTVSRYDDMMKIKGVNIWPEMIDEIILTKDEASEYQGRLYISADSRETAEVAIEFKAGVPLDVKQNLLTRLSQELRDRTGVGFNVKEAAQPLPHAVFKIRRWTDDRVKGLEK
ncbi:MAG: AMP-binding protein [Chloroflexi bacterium]|nr:AMP-binding protein [Chloroflexota bacterium]